jgi:hypothetical protein
MIQSYFNGAGKIYSHGETVNYLVRSAKDLEAIIIFFDKYPLITQKRADFELFKLIVSMVTKGEHLKREGFIKILSLRASINTGLSDKLKEVFPDIVPTPRPMVVGSAQKIKDPNWLAGFSAGEGCFDIRVVQSDSYKLGANAVLRFRIVQHSRDAGLLQSFATYLNCGKYLPAKNQFHGTFVVSKFSDIIGKIIPFFDKYPIRGVKTQDFLDFKRAAEIMKVKGHLTQAGLNEIRRIKAGMNSERETIPKSVLVLHNKKNIKGKRMFSTTIKPQGEKVAGYPAIVFMLLILKNSNTKNGLQIAPCFSIGLHIKDKAILEEIKAYFEGIGNITYPKKDVALYRVTSKKYFTVIINHFDKFPLISRADYQLFKIAVESVKCKEHLTKEGLHTILSIRAAMNNGLSA